jgi:hypothetical protein
MMQAWYVLMSVGLSIFFWSTNASSEFGVYLNPKMQMRAKVILHKHCWRPLFLFFLFVTLVNLELQVLPQ